MNLPYDKHAHKKWLVWYIKHASPSESQQKKRLKQHERNAFAHMHTLTTMKPCLGFILNVLILNFIINYKIIS